MSNRLFGLIIILALSGCANFKLYTDIGYKLGLPKQVTTGSVMLHYEEGLKDFAGQISDGYRHELIYTGIEHGVVSIAYRELYANKDSKYARPAFGLELKYDINSSRTIAFRNYKIMIDSATAEFIAFTVLAAATLNTPQTTPEIFYPESDIRKIRVLTSNDQLFEGYLVGEDFECYFLNQFGPVKTGFLRIFKNRIKKIDPIN